MVKFLRFSKIFRIYEVFQPFIKFSLHVENEIKSDNALVIAPHGDDEAIGCGGAIRKLASSGTNVTLAVLTDQGRLRSDETALSAKMLGINEVFNLGLREESLEHDLSLGDKLREIIDKYSPDTVFVPFLLDNHTDHRGLNKALIQMGDSFQNKFMVYSYAVWLPLYPNFLLDIGHVWEIKKQAIEFYKSQTASRDYVTMSYSLSKYWATAKGSGYDLLESYWRGTLKEYVKLGQAIFREYRFSTNRISIER